MMDKNGVRTTAEKEPYILANSRMLQTLQSSGVSFFEKDDLRRRTEPTTFAQNNANRHRSKFRKNRSCC